MRRRSCKKEVSAGVVGASAWRARLWANSSGVRCLRGCLDGGNGR